MDCETTADLTDALRNLDDGGWQALPALARLDAAGHRLIIDRTASDTIGAPVVILRERLAPPEGLTPRQRDVALAVSRGQSNAEVAQALGLSVATVKDHVHAILSRLGLKRRGEIAAACHRRQDYGRERAR